MNNKNRPKNNKGKKRPLGVIMQLKYARKAAISRAEDRFGEMLSMNLSKNAHTRALEATQNVLIAIDNAINAQIDLQQYEAEESARQQKAQLRNSPRLEH